MNETADGDEISQSNSIPATVIEESSAVPARPSEALLIEFLARESWPSQHARVFCVTVGRAQLAAWATREMRADSVDCLLLDLYQARECRRLHGGREGLRILCQPDPPDGPFDVALLPLSAFGDGEWTRDLLQSVHARLVEGGRLWASTDSPSDKWLRTELERLFDRVSAHVQKQGVVYVAKKTGPGPRKKLKDYSAEFRFRDGGRLLRVFTRPGVFSHRHLDTGARALIEKVVVNPGDQVADLGCGAGVVALAIAAREPTCRVTAVDSSARAVECTRRNAELNELPNIEVRHDADGNCGEPGAFDLVVGNPPYYSNHQIAAIFVDGARAALRPGGLLQIVTKDARWYCENLVDDFEEIQVEPSRAYLIVSARRR